MVEADEVAGWCSYLGFSSSSAQLCGARHEVTVTFTLKGATQPTGRFAEVTVTFGLGKFASMSIVNLNRNSLQGEDAQHRLSKLRLPGILTY